MSTFEIKRESGKIFCPLTNSWHIETPEEKVRQEYIKKLVDDYGYSLDQMAQGDSSQQLAAWAGQFKSRHCYLEVIQRYE